MTSDTGRDWTDERVAALVGNLLRIGVGLAATVVAVGGLLYLARHGGEPVAYHVFRGEPHALRSVPGIVSSVFALGARGIIQFGLLLLIATPVARVAFSAVAFMLERDRTYVIVTLIVLATLLYSLAAS
jgi:uncharacterized membrane protein